MSIILQHEFWDLAVNGDGFEVSLSFSRKPERLSIPFAAITGFSDPSVPTFGFKFMVPEVSDLASSAPAPGPSALAKTKSEPAQPAKPPAPAAKPAKPSSPSKTPEPPPPSLAGPKPAEKDAAKVVSIDAFRKK